MRSRWMGLLGFALLWPGTATAGQRSGEQTKFVLLDPGGSTRFALSEEAYKLASLRVLQVPEWVGVLSRLLPFQVIDVTSPAVPIAITVRDFTSAGDPPGNLTASAIGSGPYLEVNWFPISTGNDMGLPAQPRAYNVTIENLDTKNPALFWLQTN